MARRLPDRLRRCAATQIRLFPHERDALVDAAARLGRTQTQLLRLGMAATLAWLDAAEQLAGDDADADRQQSAA